MLLHRLFLILTLLVATPTWALDFHASPAITGLFNQAKVRGTFVLYDVSQQQWIGHDQQRAETRFIPASTFKIPNSLIGLATGVVTSVDDVFYHYDGKPKYLKFWERDMGLREAIKVSNMEAYQVLARRIGAKRMQDNLTSLHFGNAHIGQSVDTFWLDGSLQVSAIEQATFLARLAQGQLPYPANVQAAVRDILTLEEGRDWVLYGKTGWSDKDLPGVGWFVGWVEHKHSGTIHSFALNLDVPRDTTPPALPTAIPKRIELAKASLRALHLLPEEHL